MANEPWRRRTRPRWCEPAKDGAPITDGVFPEAKEFLLGYWIVDVESPERAYRDRRPAVGGAPAPAGARLNMPIEVRQIMSRKTEELA